MVYLPEYHVSIVVMINAFPSKGASVIAKGLIRVVLKELDAIGYASVNKLDDIETGSYAADKRVAEDMVVTQKIKNWLQDRCVSLCSLAKYHTSHHCKYHPEFRPNNRCNPRHNHHST